MNPCVLKKIHQYGFSAFQIMQPGIWESSNKPSSKKWCWAIWRNQLSQHWYPRPLSRRLCHPDSSNRRNDFQWVSVEITSQVGVGIGPLTIIHLLVPRVTIMTFSPFCSVSSSILSVTRVLPSSNCGFGYPRFICPSSITFFRQLIVSHTIFTISVSQVEHHFGLPQKSRP